MDKTYDVISVGGGSNGLIAAAYLAVAGKKVLVLERNEWLGGGVVTREVTAPGFKHDLHSTVHIFIQANPLLLNDELGLLSRFGLKYIYPEASFSTIFEDGSSIVTYLDVEKTCQSIAQFSAKDAAAYRKFASYAARMLPMITEVLYVPPAPTGAFMSLLDQSPEGQDLIRLLSQSTYDIVNEWFENEKVKIHLLKFASESLAGPEEKGCGLTLFFMSGFVHKYPQGIPVGGSVALTEAVVRCIEHHGGVVLTNKEVARVTSSNGRATGVVLKDGETFQARDGIIGAIHPHLLGRIVEGVPEDIAERGRKVELSAFSAMNTHYALREAPKFRVKDEIAGSAGLIELVPSELAAFRRTFDDYRYGRLPSAPSYCVTVHSNYDPSRAPAGQATLYLYSFMPYELAEGGHARWDEIKEQVADRMLDDFRKFTTNMGPENIIARHVDSPVDMARHTDSFQKGDIHGIAPYFYQFFGFRPLPELAQYTVPNVERLYLAGPFMHPMGGVWGGGRATAMKMLEELGLDFDRVASVYGGKSRP